MTRVGSLLCAVVACAACSSSDATAIRCGTGTQGTLTASAPVVVTADDGADLRGAAIAADAHTTLPPAPVTIGCAAEDIVPAGYIALGPAVSFGADGTTSDRPFELTLPYKASRLPPGATRRHVRVIAKPAGVAAFFPAISNYLFDDSDADAERVTFRAGELTTYQVVTTPDAGQPTTEVFGWTALVGVSMGGNAAMALALRHTDRFDAFADLGGLPGPSMTYTLDMANAFVFGGFCTAADQAAGSGAIGHLCPQPSTKPDQFEISSDFEHLTSQGSGVGFTLDRSLYMKLTRDLVRALSNPLVFTAPGSYAPPDIGSAFLAELPAVRCGSATALASFFDRDFNPAGSAQVITFCDGGADPDAPGVFDPAVAQQDPVEPALAVDLNGNGVRDSGEPLLVQAFEPFADVGSDGLADPDEPGYDPITNPDPDHDDYHYLRNPLGTEGNGTWDPGEPFDDVGLDGVAGTCQLGATPGSGIAGCYDVGEGNGVWDMSPNVASWYAYDLVAELAALTPGPRAHVAMWLDGGIRDFFNTAVSANQAVGQAMARFGAPFRVYDGFAPIAQGSDDDSYNPTALDWSSVPRDGLVRYGDPDATADVIADGDGAHLGTAAQLQDRVTTALAWLDQRWPDGDRSDADGSGTLLADQTFTSPSTGRVNAFSVFLPPGYADPANAAKQYPVAYVLHGYGQQPSDLVALAAQATSAMTTAQPAATRVQKMILVFVDGRCVPGGDGVPVPAGGDGCEEGTFYLNSPGGQVAMEQNLLDLIGFIDKSFRTRPASTETFVP